MEERMPYERVASSDMMRYQREQRSYQEVQRRYTELRAAAEQDGAALFATSLAVSLLMLVVQ